MLAGAAHAQALRPAASNVVHRRSAAVRRKAGAVAAGRGHPGGIVTFLFRT
jgi:hypothetical protein